MRHLYQILEFNQVLETLSSYAITPMAKRTLLALSHLTDRVQIQEALDHTKEAMDIVYQYGRCPIEMIHDIEESLNKAHKDGVLIPEELYRIASQVEGIRKIKEFKTSLKNITAKNFYYYVDTLSPTLSFQEEVNRCIAPSLELYDHASSKLQRLRKDLRTKEQEIRKKLDTILRQYSTYMSDMLIVIRNDRLVLPVKISYKFALGGIIHDQSDSRQTAYVEPEAVMTMNADFMRMQREEKDEEERILAALSAMVKANYDVLLSNLRLIENIDVMFAKGAYGKAIRGVVATLSDQQEIILEKARHPLIDQKLVVANDFHLGGSDKKIYLITGPNTGGKTVALKTVGLLTLMNQSGLAVPVDFNAKLGIFEDFFVDIGDEQSLEQSLSTFSSHMKKLIATVLEASDKSMIILDEVGGGTDPREGEAIAMAILDYFHRIGSIVLATTHYSNLKSFAFDQGYITNASMVFDAERLAPTYRLMHGVSGRSYALEISARLGLPVSLIEKARNYQSHYSSNQEQLAEKMEQELTQLHLQQEQLAKAKEALDNQLNLAGKKVYELETEQRKLRYEADKKIAELIEGAEEEISTIVDSIKNKQPETVKMHEWIAAKSALRTLKGQEEEQEITDTELNIGDDVMILSLQKRGKISRKSGNEYTVTAGRVSLQVSGNDLQRVAKDKTAKIISMHAERKLVQVPVELNLIGLRVEEALVLLDRYLDSALLVHMKSVRIVHGSGTGALRSGVHQFLDKAKYVKEYRLGGAGEGGVGATVVTFKE